MDEATFERNTKDARLIKRFACCTSGTRSCATRLLPYHGRSLGLDKFPDVAAGAKRWSGSGSSQTRELVDESPGTLAPGADDRVTESLEQMKTCLRALLAIFSVRYPALTATAPRTR